MDSASDNWFTLDVAGDAIVAGDSSAKDKRSQDLERLVFGDNFSSRLKSQKSSGSAVKEKLQSKDRAKRTVPSQQKKTGRPAAGAASDDGDDGSAGDNVAGSSDGDAGSSDLVKVARDSGLVRAPAWQDEDDDAVQVHVGSAASRLRLTPYFVTTSHTLNLMQAATHSPSGGLVVQAAHEEAAVE
jgi:hypothetical protein